MLFSTKFDISNNPTVTETAPEVCVAGLAIGLVLAAVVHATVSHGCFATSRRSLARRGPLNPFCP